MVRASPGDIPKPLREFKGAEMLPLRRKDPNPSRTRTVDVAFLVYLHPVGRAHSRIRAGIEKYLRVRQYSVRLDGITHPQLLGLRIVDEKEISHLEKRQYHWAEAGP